VSEINEEQRRLQQDPLGLSPDAALQFEHPRLAVTAVIDESSFAYRLGQAVERSNRIKNGEVVVNGRKLIEGPKTHLK
jgi:hypothetical protein